MKDEPGRYSAAILIGGKATRFEGSDTVAALVDGQTILSRLVVPRTERGYHPVYRAIANGMQS